MKKIFLFVILIIISISNITSLYALQNNQYQINFEAINNTQDIVKFGYELSNTSYVVDYINAYDTDNECKVFTAINKQYGRVALFIANKDNDILYKTENLECNYFLNDSLYQTNVDVAAIALRDINDDELKDILLVSRCVDNNKQFKIGDVLLQGSDSFYRDWRISDKINRFSMNKDIDMMTAFVRDGYSSAFLYSASTLDELVKGGFKTLDDQIFNVDFEKIGDVKVVPGTYFMGEQNIFIIYLINTDGQVVWNFQCMKDYDNFNRMTGISFKDVDGDGWPDLSVLAKYNTLDNHNKTYTITDFSIYYQRNGYFFEDTDFHKSFFDKLTGEEIMNDIVTQARKYWGW